MRKGLAIGLVVLAIVVLFVLGIFVLGVAFWMEKTRVPKKTILEADLEQELVEYIPEDPLAKVLLSKTPTLRDFVEALERGAEDDRVVGLIARVGSSGMGLGQIQEIRDALATFRESGKSAVAYAETLGEFGPGNGAYYLATAFEEIYLQPSGDVNLTGLLYESPFLRGTLEKLGITPRMDHRYEYKNAMNLWTERQFTEPHREAMEALMNSHFRQLLRGIAQGRGLEEEAIQVLIDQGPYYGEEALAAGLVDGLAYRDEVYEKVQERVGEDTKFLSFTQYLKRAGRPHQKGATIALIYGVGGVHRGKSSYDPLTGEATMGSDTVAGALRAAAEDDEVQAIVFRVDSPGGSYVASDTIWREVVRAQEAGKPVVVSMGEVAASGGYFVAMAADKIVAQPGTITGSIGVVAGKMLTDGFWDKLGISWDGVQTSAHATMWSGTHDYTPEEWDRFQAFLDRVYEDFTRKVAEGRELPLEKVLEVAKGRIWTGEDAQELGLVDELGGFQVALRLAREAAGLGEDDPVHLKVFPPKKTPLELLLQEDSERNEFPSQVALARLLRVAQPAFRMARELGLVGNEAGELRTHPVATVP